LLNQQYPAVVAVDHPVLSVIRGNGCAVVVLGYFQIFNHPELCANCYGMVLIAIDVSYRFSGGGGKSHFIAVYDAFTVDRIGSHVIGGAFFLSLVTGHESLVAGLRALAFCRYSLATTLYFLFSISCFLFLVACSLLALAFGIFLFLG
jgi:hypothetical protein